MKMLIYVILHGVYLINEWNAIIDLQNDMVKKYPEPNDLYIYKKILSILALKKLGRYIP